MDKMTQQNAAMVEETTAAARSLASEAQGLRQLVSRFKLNRKAVQSEMPHSATTAALAKSPVAAAARSSSPVSTGNLALSLDADDWSEF